MLLFKLVCFANEHLGKFFFPGAEHHEGHLSLLRSSLVNSRTQSMVYDDLGMSEYVIFSNIHSSHDGPEMKTKQRADILECEKFFVLFCLFFFFNIVLASPFSFWFVSFLLHNSSQLKLISLCQIHMDRMAMTLCFCIFVFIQACVV